MTMTHEDEKKRYEELSKEVRHDDPFRPQLFSSPPVFVTAEQLANIKQVLSYSCSDSRFAQKAFFAIEHILTNTPAQIEPPMESAHLKESPVPFPTFDQVKDADKKRKEAKDKGLYPTGHEPRLWLDRP